MTNKPTPFFCSDNNAAVQPEPIDAIRSQLANSVIIASIIISFFALIASICRAIFVEGKDIALLQICLFLMGLAFTCFYRRFPYVFRALFVPGALFIVGIADLWRWGLMGMGIPLFITTCILITIFFGGRCGLVAFAASLGAITVAGAGIQLGWISFKFDIDAYALSPFSWLIAAIGFCYFLGLIITILIRLQASLIDIIGERKKRTSELQVTNEKLKGEIVERKQVEDVLKKTMGYFQLHSDLANTLIKTPLNEIGQTIEHFLRRTAEFYDVDRGNLIYWPEGCTNSREIYSWTRAEIRPYRMLDSYDKYSYIANAVMNGKIFSFSDVDELPPEAQAEKDFFLHEGTKSAIRIPMMVEDKILGLLMFDSFRTEKTWTDNLAQQLQLIGQTFTHSLERKHAEETIRESEDKLRVIFENVNDEIVYMDNQGTIIDTNKEVDIFGFRREEVIGKNFTEFEFYHPDKLETLTEQFNEALSGGHKKFIEMEGKRKDGAEILFEVSTNVIKQESEVKNLVVVVRDITKRKKLEARLQQAQKMEAIGTLAGGVAHDLNNILSGVVSYPELLLMNLAEDNPLRKPMLTIKKSGEKAASIVSDLLTLARRGVVVTEAVNLNDIVTEYLESPEHEKLKSYHPHVRVETDFETNLQNITGSPVHLSKTVMNLVSNAAEAITEEGEILISTKNRYLDKPFKAYDHIEEGDYVVFSVSDTGVGISSEDLERIFEPFYTKKVMGRSGTGLGMAVVWGTVKDHKGYIDIETTEGKGTTFTLYFPMSRESTAKDEPKFPIEKYMGKGESVFIVDDVEEQRIVASDMLEGLGYSVKSFSSGEKAADYMKDHSADLLVLDMIMDPGIDGLETYKRILKDHPNQKAIITSGFSETEHVKEAQKLGAGKYVKKPYTLEQIGRAAKAELDKS